MTSIGSAPPPKPPELAALAAQHEDHEKALIALAAAQDEIGELKDRRREERVGWIAVCVILIDCGLMLNATNPTAPAIIGFLQVGILAFVAKRMGVEEFYALFSNLIQRVGKLAGGD